MSQDNKNPPIFTHTHTDNHAHTAGPKERVKINTLAALSVDYAKMGRGGW